MNKPKRESDKLLFVPVALDFKYFSTYINLNHIEEIVVDTKSLRITIYWNSGRQSILTSYQAASFIKQLSIFNFKYGKAFYDDLVESFESTNLKFCDYLDEHE